MDSSSQTLEGLVYDIHTHVYCRCRFFTALHVSHEASYGPMPEGNIDYGKYFFGVQMKPTGKGNMIAREISFSLHLPDTSQLERLTCTISQNIVTLQSQYLVAAFFTALDKCAFKHLTSVYSKVFGRLTASRMESRGMLWIKCVSHLFTYLLKYYI